MTNRRRPEWRTIAEQVSDVEDGFGRPGWEHDPDDGGFVTTGATRPRVTVARSWGPGLTERQKTASGRRFRARTARSWGRMRQLMDKTGMSMEEFVASLSNEELARGQIKNKDGKFMGRPPTWVPREFHRACLKELMNRGAILWRTNYVEAIEVMTQIAMGQGAGKRATPAERMRAAQYVIERLEGKIPERIEVTADAPWEALIAGIVANVSDEQIGAARRVLAGDVPEIIDGEVVEDEEVEPEPVVRRRRAERTPRRR